MSITTLDGALAGMMPPVFFFKAISPTLVAGRPHSLWYLNGNPGPGAANTTSAGGVVRTSPVNGGLSWTDPGGANTSYLSRFAGSATQGGILMLCDRLWDCGANSAGGALSPTAITAQTITSTTWPSRDISGSTNGAGIFIGVEVSTALGSGTPTYTMAYTSSSGANARSATNSFAVVASSAIGSFYPIGLQAGDSGVRSIQTITASATQTSGQWNLVAYRILATMEIVAGSVGNSIDLITSGFPQLFNGTVPFLIFIPNTTTASYVFGSMSVTQG